MPIQPDNGSPESRMKIVLIDDCPDFCNLLRGFAERRGFYIETYHSLADMHSIGKFRQFDVALIDYHLEAWCGLEIADYIDVFFKDLPVVLISGDSDVQKKHSWPESVRTFVDKAKGPNHILTCAANTVEDFRFYSSLKKRAFGTDFSSEGKVC